MGKSRFAFDFSQMEELAKSIEDIGGNIKDAAEDALNQTADFITKGLEATWPSHNYTGATGSTLDSTPRVTWKNDWTAEVHIGFHMNAGGWPSIFIMWGTPKHRADMALQNAAFGLKTNLQVREIQFQALQKYIEEHGG